MTDQIDRRLIAILEDTIERCEKQPPQAHGFPVKTTLFFIAISMVITGFMLHFSLENQQLKALAASYEQTIRPPATMQPTPVIFSPYVIQDNTPDCAGPVMTLNGQPICATMDPI